MALHQSRMVPDARMIFFQFIYFFFYLLKNICDGLRGITAHAIHKRITRFYIQFYSSNAGAVLPTVMLFFHQQVELIKAPQHCAIFLMVIRERLPQADECKAKFVFYRVTHESFCEEKAQS